MNKLKNYLIYDKKLKKWTKNSTFAHFSLYFLNFIKNHQLHN